ncbi:MAG: DUF1330 domain-containing protein [Pseudomonadales bacterium]
MSAYIVAHITIEDRARYSQYEAGFMAIFQKYQGRMLFAAARSHVVLLQGLG